MNYTLSLPDALCAGTDPHTLYTLERNYPKFIVLDLSQAIEAIENVCLGFYTDYVELAELACRIYSDVGDFYSIDDELSEYVDESVYVQQVSKTRPMYSAHARLFFNSYKQACSQYIEFIIASLLKARVPYFETRSVYMPDAFVYGTWCLKLMLKLDD